MIYHVQKPKPLPKVPSSTNVQSFLAAKIQWMVKRLQNLWSPSEFLTRAALWDAEKLLNARQPARQLEGLRRLLELDSEKDRAFFRVASVQQQARRIEQELSHLLARQQIEQEVQEQVTECYRKRYRQDLQEMKLQALQELSRKSENPSTLRRLFQLQKMEAVKLPPQAMEWLRPRTPQELIGQEEAIQALICRLNTPYPQHLLLYGPPGVGKTSSARLALDMIKKMPGSPFAADAPFIEVDGTTLRWDPREAVNPLLGSVHDPLFQGAKRELAADGIPEPKTGLVAKAHGGILFIDEIGAMDPALQNQLLKVLEDKRVFFDSSYYDPQNPQIPAYIRQIFEQGVPADFILIGATTSPPEAISPAFRSRCAEIFFQPPDQKQLVQILENSAHKLRIQTAPEVLEQISRCCQDGRTANKLLSDAFGIALNRSGASAWTTENDTTITVEDVHTALRQAQSTPIFPSKPDTRPIAGKIHSVGVTQYFGQLLTLECAAFPCQTPGSGSIRYNATAGAALQDAAFNALVALRGLIKKNPLDYDLYLNFVGGNRVDGPSAGAAIALVMMSAIENRPLKQDVAVTGEISLHGTLCPVGGLPQKIAAAKAAGVHTLLVPTANSLPAIPKNDGLQLIPIHTLSDAFPYVFVG